MRLPQYLTLEGKTKTIAAWARDPCCVPDINTLRRRLRLGWPLADALRVPVRPEVRLTAWGETKTLAAWSWDPRARGGLKTLRWRRHQGWEPEVVVAGR